MKPTIEDCKEAFQYGYEEFEPSSMEAARVWNAYHNRQYTEEQLLTLENRGQPKETFNVIKLFARMLIGYYSGVVNTVNIKPRHPRFITQAALLNDLVSYELDNNKISTTVGDEIKLSGLISGLMCSHEQLVDTGERDQFNLPIYTQKITHVPDYEVVLDPRSTLSDYSDSRWQHRFKWMTKTDVIKTFGKQAFDKLTANYNFTGAPSADLDYRQALTQQHYMSPTFNGSYKVHKNYLVVHTVWEDDEGKRWSLYWHDDIELQSKEITYKQVRWPYRVQKLHTSDKIEYYGIFREVIESQDSINQALIQIQLMANTSKVLVEDGAVEDIEEFRRSYNRVNGVIPVIDAKGIRVEELSREIADQYIIIDKAFDRIQRVLGINDSFLGMAFASDSGRKVKLQQNASIMSLRYVTARIEDFYESLAKDVASLAQQYYTSNQFILVTDAYTGERFAELNAPMLDERGQPIFVEQLDPETGKPLEDEEGNLIFAPLTTRESDISELSYQIKIESSSYNDGDEKAQLMIESVLSGNIGSIMSQVAPAEFFKVASLAIKNMGTKHSPEISAVIDSVAQKLGGSPQAQQEASMLAQGGASSQNGMSSQLKLPQNTNEA